MYILAIDSSAVSASCCVYEAGDKSGRIISYGFVNVGLTHSRTLLPLIADTIKNSALRLEQMDYIALTQGPGSFTGVRIGVATVKGMAFTHNIPCIGISTLEAISAGCQGLKGCICAVMDARREQVYNALFRLGVKQKRLTADRAIAIEDLSAELREVKGDIWLAGDGAELCYNRLKETHSNVRPAPPFCHYQNGVGVALAAIEKIKNNQFVSASELKPSYLRLPQAERELNNKRKLTEEV